MKLILPSGTTRAAFDRGLAAFERVVGKDWVLATDEDRETYLDVYAPGDAEAHRRLEAGGTRGRLVIQF